MEIIDEVNQIVEDEKVKWNLQEKRSKERARERGIEREGEKETAVKKENKKIENEEK